MALSVLWIAFLLNMLLSCVLYHILGPDKPDDLPPSLFCTFCSLSSHFPSPSPFPSSLSSPSPYPSLSPSPSPSRSPLYRLSRSPIVHSFSPPLPLLSILHTSPVSYPFFSLSHSLFPPSFFPFFISGLFFAVFLASTFV